MEVWGSATKVQNHVWRVPEMVGGTRERQRPWRETAATLLTAKQYFQIATVYESAAADTMTVPRQQRAAFIRKVVSHAGSHKSCEGGSGGP